MATAASTVQTIPKNTRVTGETRAALGKALREKYEAGATIRQLNQQTGRSFGSIQRLLADAGATMRPRGGSRKS